ncbi:MAG: mechanosensitive ion channel family protein [bacterium]|nr:mechanosensitive ion channel family protein [bacterium]
MNLQELVGDLGREHPIVVQIIGLGVLVFIGWLADLVANRWMLRLVRGVASRSANRWDDALLQARFFNRAANLVPALFIYFGIHLFSFEPAVELVVQRIVLASSVLISAAAVSALLNAAAEIYAQLSDASRRPIKGYLGFVRLIVYLICGIITLSILMDRSPWIFLSGLGAVSAVLLIVFRDTLLSLVASVQITNNRLLNVGDWIEMPDYGADGDVIDVTLHTVKVQNWDKTITTVPTHAFITHSFKNWQGMSESESRRIKRCLYVDVTSIRFLEEDEIDRFGGFALLSDYVAAKRGELRAHNAETGRNPQINADIRRLTNVGMLRAYMFEYLKNHPKIHQGRTLIVRQLPPSPEGLPIEIYCFTNDIAWANHEGIQSDLFDHFLAIAPEFGLRIFQRPSGADLSSLGSQASH